MSAVATDISVYERNEKQEFKQLPEISNIELCSACNLACPMCLRTTHLGRQPGLVSLELIKKMHQRGDFEGTTYTELQIAGEPTLHPETYDIIRYLKEDVRILVGMSTHGLELTKRNNTAALAMLDALTISIDSVDPEIYHKMRFPAELPELYLNLDYFFNYCRHRKRAGHKLPMIELQLVITPLVEGTGNVTALEDKMRQEGWDKLAVIRTMYDCFEGMQDRIEIEQVKKKIHGICLNPWTGVAVAHNGDVVSCGLIFTPKKDEINFYGNLNDNSLAEIWNNDRLKNMRDVMAAHAGMGIDLQGQCAKCTVRSHHAIHTQIVSRLVQLRGI